MTDVAHHSGHRQRLREKLTLAGGEALHDYELLELYLFRAIPRRDVKPIAKDPVSYTHLTLPTKA